MHQLNYALVPERPSDAPIYRRGWRPIKPRYKPYARPAAGAAAVLTTRRRLHRDVRPRASAATHQEPVEQMDVDPAPPTHNFEVPAGNIRGRPEISAGALKAKWVPARNIPSLDPARGRLEIPADAPKARWGGQGSVFDSPVLESMPVSRRKRKSYEESTEPSITPPKVKKRRIDLPAPSAESSPICSRKAEKSRATDEPVDVPPTSLRKMEKSRAQDQAELVNATSSASSKTVKEPCLPPPVRRPIMMENMASSSKVKLEDVPLPAEVAKAPAAINLSPLALITNVEVNNTLMSLKRPVENIKLSVIPPCEPTFVTFSNIGQPENSNDVPDIIMFEDDYVNLPPIIDATDIIMFEDDYVDFPPIIAGYVPEYGDYMQLDPADTPNDIIPFNAIPLGVQELSDTMEVEWVGPSIPSDNNVAANHGPVINGPPYAGPPVMAENIFAPNLGMPGTQAFNPLHAHPNVFPSNAGIIDPPYYPREPLLGPRPQAYHVQPPAPEALNAPAIIPVQEQPIGHADGRAELFDELFGNDGEEEDEEEEETGAQELPWTTAGDVVEEHGDGEEEEDEVEIVI